MTRTLLLDLFCGAGGAAVGYHRAGFDVVGVDIEPQPNYPFPFVQADALNPPFDLASFDAIHASPPCQRFSPSTPNPDKWPDLVDPMRQVLLASGKPYVMENVRHAGLAGHLMLCGSMFGLQVQRHRIFELSDHTPLLLSPSCNHRAWADGRPWVVVGEPGGFNQGAMGGQNRHKYQDLAHAQTLMEMSWTETEREVCEAIPPAYAEFYWSPHPRTP